MKGAGNVQDEARKAVCRCAEKAINQKNVRLLDDHPGYWQTRQVFPLLFAAFPDLSSTIEQQTVDGEWVTTRATLRGTHLGNFMGIAPTGKTVVTMNISLDQVVHGKIVEHFGASDLMSAFVAFGVLTPDAAFAGPLAR
jgi:predicted ester cyclase